jgi:AcrR family transcriptional regulator
MAGMPKRNWEVRAAERALDRLADADVRSLRPKPPATLVAAAQELARAGDFTVKQVADRAGVALQTFYRHFGSKDELMLAVLEENILQSMDEIEQRANKHEDPLDRLAAVVRAPFLMVIAERDLRSLRFQARERVRLSEEFPAEVEACLSPYRDLLIEYIGEAVDAGVVFPLDVGRDADIILHLVFMYTHNVAAHAVPDADHVADYLWNFCLAGLLRGGTNGAPDASTVSRTVR